MLGQSPTVGRARAFRGIYRTRRSHVYGSIYEAHGCLAANVPTGCLWTKRKGLTSRRTTDRHETNSTGLIRAKEVAEAGVPVLQQ